MAERNKFDQDEKLNRSFNLDMIKKSGKYILAEKKNFAFAILFQVIAILASLAEPTLTQHALDDCIPDKDIRGLVITTILFAICIAINITMLKFASRFVAIIGQNIIYKIRKDLYAHLQKMSSNYYDSKPHGKILIRVVNYVNSVATILSNGLIDCFLQMINLVFILVFMLAMNVKLSLIVLSGLPFTIITVLALKPLQRKGWQEVSNKSSNVNAFLNESILCMKISQLFAREKYNTNIFKRLSNEYKKSWFHAVLPSTAVGPIINLISKLVIVVMMYVSVIYFRTEVTIGVILAMIQYCTKFWQPIIQLGNIYNQFVNNVAYLERIYEVMDEPIEVCDKENASVLPEIKGNVEFKNVTFEYEPGIPVLNNVSFSVRAGESVALVGPTGAGKSTIVNLISRFYNITKGQVLIDGHDISEVTLDSLRSQMGIMMQDSFVFSDTIYENIRYGKLSADYQDISRAAELVLANTFIDKMPKQYNTKMTEGGSDLSQGQRQLLSFARTIVSDPRILILDEATSSIDTKTEALLQEGINRVLKGRTSFIVAHRLSTIKSCDKIMYILDGKIAESGTFDELMAKKGLYYQLYQNS